MLTFQLLAEALSRRDGLVLFAVIAIGSLSVMVADDWWKRFLVRKARRKGKPVPENWLQNRTDWRILASLIAGFVLYLFLLSNPHLTNRDFGPLDPMMKWLFANPRR